MIMPQSSRNKKRRRLSGRGIRGAAVLELMLMLPLLMMIMVLAVDAGRFASTFIAVTNAARAGAYYGSYHPVGNKANWDAAIRQAVEDELSSNSWFDASDLVVAEPLHSDDGLGRRRVTVDVTYPFDAILDWNLFGTATSFPIRRVVVMRGIR